MLQRKLVSIRTVTFQAITIGTLLNAMALCQERSPTISVTGEAEVRLLADEIVIHASIESRAKTAADACKDNREKSRMLIEFLKTRSVDENLINMDLLSIDEIHPARTASKSKDVQSNSEDEDPFGAPEAEESFLGGPRRAIGFTAFRKFAIVVKDLKKFEEIYQGIVEKGVNRVDRVQHRSSKEKANIEKIRLEAVRVAQQRAKEMASQLGAKLSEIQSISNSRVSSGSGRTGMGLMGMGAGYGDDPFGPDDSSPSESYITLRSSVDVVFILGDAKLKQ